MRDPALPNPFTIVAQLTAYHHVHEVGPKTKFLPELMKAMIELGRPFSKADVADAFPNTTNKIPDMLRYACTAGYLFTSRVEGRTNDRIVFYDFTAKGRKKCESL